MIAVLQWNPVGYVAMVALVVAAILVPLTGWAMRRGGDRHPRMSRTAANRTQWPHG